MTAYAREIEDIVQSKNPSSIETMPKGTRYITLLYHQVTKYPLRDREEHNFEIPESCG
jgi:hypothetical protein